MPGVICEGPIAGIRGRSSCYSLALPPPPPPSFSLKHDMVGFLPICHRICTAHHREMAGIFFHDEHLDQFGVFSEHMSKPSLDMQGASSSQSG